MKKYFLLTSIFAIGFAIPAFSDPFTANQTYADSCTYGETLNTPTTAPTAPRGHYFIGWSFN